MDSLNLKLDSWTNKPKILVKELNKEIDLGAIYEEKL